MLLYTRILFSSCSRFRTPNARFRMRRKQANFLQILGSYELDSLYKCAHNTYR
jgi:hypothetical protein